MKIDLYWSMLSQEGQAKVLEHYCVSEDEKSDKSPIGNISSWDNREDYPSHESKIKRGRTAYDRERDLW